MKYSLKRVAAIVLGLYLLLSCYTAYNLLLNRSESDRRSDGILPSDSREVDPWVKLEQGNHGDQHINLPRMKWPHDLHIENGAKIHVVEIWGKSAIGLYLWQHIFQAYLEEKMSGVWHYGETQINNTIFRFRTGPGVVPDKVPQHVEHLVLVLNGREQAKIEFARTWLDYLPHYPLLQNVAVVLLGDEQCNNDWLDQYMVANGGPVKVVFLVYDSPEVDDVNVFQWPLGVATYRNFPVVIPETVQVMKSRAFACNFVGTVYRNSSRETLLRVIRDHKLQTTCFTKPRMQWVSQETGQSQSDYITAVQQSYLTLNPVGQNAECYRIYEALSLGSVPVIEDRATSKQCRSPHRLLKEYKAPVIYVTDWHDLPSLLKKEKALKPVDLVRRQERVLRWYLDFRTKMRDKFVSVLRQKFFT